MGTSLRQIPIVGLYRSSATHFTVTEVFIELTSGTLQTLILLELTSTRWTPQKWRPEVGLILL